MKLNVFSLVWISSVFMALSSVNARSNSDYNKQIQDGGELEEELEAEKTSENLLEALELLRQRSCRYDPRCATPSNSNPSNTGEVIEDEMDAEKAKEELLEALELVRRGICGTDKNCDTPKKSSPSNTGEVIEGEMDAEKAKEELLEALELVRREENCRTNDKCGTPIKSSPYKSSPYKSNTGIKTKEDTQEEGGKKELQPQQRLGAPCRHLSHCIFNLKTRSEAGGPQFAGGQRPPQVQRNPLDDGGPRPPQVQRNPLDDGVQRPPQVQRNLFDDGVQRPPQVQRNPLDDGGLRPPQVHRNPLDGGFQRPPQVQRGISGKYFKRTHDRLHQPQQKSSIVADVPPGRQSEFDYPSADAVEARRNYDYQSSRTDVDTADQEVSADEILVSLLKLIRSKREN